MREVWRMWSYSTMVVLTVLTAGLFAAILIPFKGIPLIPGVTELRPANVIPLVFGLLFGPAGAWGAAFGNLIGDFYGTLGPGSFFGFWGNFLAAYLPYQMWRGRSLEPIGLHWLRFILAALLGGTGCALVVGFGLDSLKLLPFSIIGVAVFLNNVLVALSLGPFLFKLLAPRVSRWDLYWEEQMDPEDCRPGPAPRLGLVCAWVGAAGGYLLGLAVSMGLATWAFLPPLPLLLAPFLALLLIGCVLL
jgi:energy-coupling factor transport system substrate-specific component|uniref:QueT transporter family protein n=1 Tax=Desulfobacca acetoxidans TaxID=60893 RepID=A0A7C3V7S6_9BACT